MRRALLLLAVLATTITTTRAALRRRRALASTPVDGSPRDEYVRHWAHEGKSRCGAPNCRWMREFGPIDVGCRIEIDRVGLADGGAGPRFSLVFTDGRSTETIDARSASSVQNFVTRPALCEYVPAAARRNTTSEVALLMVANSPSFRLWGPFLNKLLYATDAGMRPMIWLGELPPALRKPTSEACLHSAEMKTRTITRRLAPTSYYDGILKAGECSNHYIKMPATLATLAHPEIKGLYYVDLDSVARYPWTTSTRLREHENNFSDVSFHPLYGSKHMGSMRWQVSGNRYYARDSVKGRAFFANWFNNRCTRDAARQSAGAAMTSTTGRCARRFKDQYSLWHTILDFAASEGCVDYAGEIFSLTYSDARGMGPTHKNYIKLDCDAIDARCPGLRYSNRGGATCNADTPHLLDDLHHRSIGTDGKGILRLVLEGGFALSLENACFAGTSSKCEVASDVSEYAALLGVAGRDRSLHPWNSTAASAPWEPVTVRSDWWAAYTKGACLNYRATPQFSLAGNCGAPERLNATLTNKLYFYSWVSSHDGELLRHFLNFYTARGIRFKEPGRARLVVSPFRESRRELLDEFVHPNNIRFEPEYSSDRKRDAVNAYLTTLPAGYLMYPDLDEFFDIPSATLDKAIVHGRGFVLGTMVDRVAHDWTLPSVTEGPLWSQFPRRCFATNKLFNGNSRKWLLVPTYVPGLNRTLQYAGSHKLQGEDLEARLKGAGLKCYGFSHYRFGAKSVKLLRDKLDLYHHGPPGPDQTRHEVYERISSFLVDATPEEFSDKFQHTVECLESCPASPPRRALASAPVELVDRVDRRRSGHAYRRALASTPGAGSPQDEYVQNWAHEGKSRCGAPNCRWIREFGPIDVGCRIEIDRVGLADGGAGPRFTLVFSDGRRKTRDASSVHQLVTRPALCEYAPRNTTSDVALLMVANEPSYLFRMWGPFLNKLLWAIDAGLRPMLWLGDLPERLQTHSSEQCRQSSEMRYLEYNGEAQRYSPRYIKIPATLAALAAPDIRGVYYVDMDAVARFPWSVDPNTLSEHTRRSSDVAFLVAHDGGLRWQVKSSRFYARDTEKGRAFFADWFENRCTSDDKYALWHTILESAASEGCVPYDDEIFRMRYSEAKHLKADDAPAALLLDCRTIDAACPSFSYSNTGGHAACNNTPPDLLDDLRLQGSGRDGLLRLWLDEYALTIENACFATDGRCEYASDVSEFAALLGVAGRDRKLHPWNSTAASAPWEPAPADSWAAYTKGACRDFHATPKFSLAGNCGAPERLNASLTDKLYFYSWVSSHDGELLRHFLLFYTARGCA